MRKKIVEFCSQGDAKARKLLTAWLYDTENSSWKTPSDIRRSSRTADFLQDNRVIFNVGGGSYRIVTKVDYARQALILRWVGYHKDYDRIDASNI